MGFHSNFSSAAAFFSAPKTKCNSAFPLSPCKFFLQCFLMLFTTSQTSPYSWLSWSFTFLLCSPSHWLLSDSSFYSHPLNGRIPRDSSFLFIVHRLTEFIQAHSLNKAGKYTHSFIHSIFIYWAPAMYQALFYSREQGKQGLYSHGVYILVEDTESNKQQQQIS